MYFNNLKDIKKYFLSINENADVTKGKYASLEKNFYETLKKYHENHQNISMKALSSTSTLMTFNPYAIIHSSHTNGTIYNTREDPQFSIILFLNTLFPEWNGILLE